MTVSTANTAPLASVPHDNHITPWWLTLLAGIAAIILGILLFTNRAATSIFLVQVIGWYWFFSGIMNIVMMFIDSRGWGWNLALGILGIVAGLWIINNPLVGTLSFGLAVVLILGIQGIIYGIVALMASFQGGGLGSAVMGVLSIIFGILLLMNNFVATLVLPSVIAVFLIIGGLVSIWAAFKQKSSGVELATAR